MVVGKNQHWHQCMRTNRKFTSEDKPSWAVSIQRTWKAMVRRFLLLSSPSLCHLHTFTYRCRITNSLSYTQNIQITPILAIDSYSRIPTTHHLYALHSSHFSTFPQAFGKMSQRHENFQNTNIYFILNLLKSSISRPDIFTVITVHCLALKLGFLSHLPTSTSLLTAYSRSGEFGSSWALFYESCNKDVVIWNAMITACTENQFFSMALEYFVQMIKEGITFDSTTLLIIISASSHKNCSKQGRIVHSLSIKVGMLSDSSLCNAVVDMYAKCGDLKSSECTFAGMECRDVVSWNTIMSSCLRNNHSEKSLLYFMEMIRSGERPDSVTLLSAISASACLGELSHGQVIHGWGVKSGFENSCYISFPNSLISLYSQCGDIEAAETVFLGMPYKDVVSWNAVIEGVASSRKIKETFDLLTEMQLVGSVEPNTTTAVTISSLCAELVLLREGKSVHGYVIRRQIGNDVKVMNSLINLYSKCKSLLKAELLFNTSPFEDLVSWNIMISGYIQNGHPKKAQSLFKEMFCSTLQFSVSTLFAILPSCDSPESLKFGESIHCWQLKLGFLNNNLAVNSLMNMYINCGELMAAFSLLQIISLVGDTSSWNTIIVACRKKGHFREALETFNSMRQQVNVCHDSITLVNVILACGILELPFEGESVHGLAIKSLMGSDARVQNALITMYGRCKNIESAISVFDLSFNRNICSWNCMISAFSQNKAEIKALELFCCLEFEPNEITIVGILSACTQLGVLRHGKQIHAHVLRLQFQENTFISAALLDMYSSCGRLDIACAIFKNSREKSDAAWNSIISAYGYHNEGRKAIELFHEMCNTGVRPTKSTFISLLSACSHSGLVTEGLWYYSRMLEEYEVEPVTEHHVCMVDMLGRSGKLHEAYEFIKKLPKPKPGVWGSMLSACTYHGDIKMGKEVAELLFELEPENVGYYISLSNMYVASGTWKEAVELREVIEQKKLRKTAAYSLIDVGCG